MDIVLLHNVRLCISNEKEKFHFSARLSDENCQIVSRVADALEILEKIMGRDTWRCID